MYVRPTRMDYIVVSTCTPVRNTRVQLHSRHCHAPWHAGSLHGGTALVCDSGRPAWWHELGMHESEQLTTVFNTSENIVFQQRSAYKPKPSKRDLQLIKYSRMLTFLIVSIQKWSTHILLH